MRNCWNRLSESKRLKRKSHPTLSRTKSRRKRNQNINKPKETESNQVSNIKVKKEVWNKLKGSSLRPLSMSESREWWRSLRNFSKELTDLKGPLGLSMKRLTTTSRALIVRKSDHLFKVCLSNWPLSLKNTSVSYSSKYQGFSTRESPFTTRNSPHKLKFTSKLWIRLLQRRLKKPRRSLTSVRRKRNSQKGPKSTWAICWTQEKSGSTKQRSLSIKVGTWRLVTRRCTGNRLRAKCLCGRTWIRCLKEKLEKQMIK